MLNFNGRVATFVPILTLVMVLNLRIRLIIKSGGGEGIRMLCPS